MKDNFEELAWEAFQQAALDKYDFTTCQRPDGSKYGSNGRCIKGSETSPASKDDKKSSSKKSGGGDVTKEKRDPSKDLKNKRGTVVGTSPRNMMIDNRTTFQKRLKTAKSDQERKLLQDAIDNINKKLASE